MIEQINDIFKKGGRLSSQLPEYEYRQIQLKMANMVGRALTEKHHLLVEAGTGTGKSLAYLVPSIIWAVKNKKRVLISTYTKTLQQQLINKDLPLLKKTLGIDFRYSLCLGANNYLCLRRYNQATLEGLFTEPTIRRQARKIASWAKITKTGLKSELNFVPDNTIWSEINRETDLCLGEKCPFRESCYYNRARKEQTHAQILVVNHHLYMANLCTEEKALPEFEAVIFDEAHNLEEVATSYLGIEISNSKIKFFLNGLFNPATDKGLVRRLRGINPEKIDQIISAVAEVRAASNLFFNNLLTKVGNQSVSRPLKPGFLNNVLREPLLALERLLEGETNNVKDGERKKELNAFIHRCQEINVGLEAILQEKIAHQVYWVEVVKGRRTTRFSLHMTPLNIAEEFRKKVLETKDTVVLTSATLSIAGSFEFIRNRLGIEEAEELVLGSFFDYQNHVLLYLNSDLPDPSRDYDWFNQALIKRIEEILQCCQGRAFVLFTNFWLIDKAYEYLSKSLPELIFLRQGNKPRHQLMEDFQKNSRSVLLGTNTFWQGVDIPGDALEAVIITKLPFAVPNDPVTEAKLEELSKEGRNPFIEYQIPQAIIMLRQGFGRLIRKRNDSGLVALLDPRLKTRSYGRKFLASLPYCRQTTRLSDVKNFFAKIRKKGNHLATKTQRHQNCNR